MSTGKRRRSAAAWRTRAILVEARARATSVAQCDDHDDLARARRIRNADRDGIDMIELPDVVPVRERHIDGSTRRGYFHIRGNDGLAATDRRADGLSHARMDDGGGMLDLAIEPDYSRFAVARRRIR